MINSEAERPGFDARQLSDHFSEPGTVRAWVGNRTLHQEVELAGWREKPLVGVRLADTDLCGRSNEIAWRMKPS